MNERVQELWYQIKSAKEAVGTSKDYYWSVVRPADIEKFAELIVRECRKVIEEDMDANPDDENFNAALDHARQIIGEHFGVE